MNKINHILFLNSSKCWSIDYNSSVGVAILKLDKDQKHLPNC